MSRKWLSYEVILENERGEVVDHYDSTSKTRVKDVFKQLYVEHRFPGGVSGLHTRATLAFRTGEEIPWPSVHAGKKLVGEKSTNDRGWTLRIETTTGRSLI